jgi:fatty-acid peroxygenase
VGTRRKDRTITLLREGYRFSDRVVGTPAGRSVLGPRAAVNDPATDEPAEAGSDASGARPGLVAGPDPVGIRLLGRPAVLVQGAQGVRVFYDGARMRRHRATPQPVRGVLFGSGAVHDLDDEPHRHRKGMFLDAVEPERLVELTDLVRAGWRERFERWRDGDDVFGAAVEVFGAAVQRWGGLTGSESDVRARSQDLFRVVDGFGSLGLRGLRALWSRLAADRWARWAVRQVRRGGLTPPAGSALALVAAHRDPSGRLLPARTAGVELLNVLRPSTAVAWYAAFAALALVEHPEWRSRVAREVAAQDGRAQNGAARNGAAQEGSAQEGSAQDGASRCPYRPAVTTADGVRAAAAGPIIAAVAHEVRRLYPFVPVLAARIRQDDAVAGCPVGRGQRVVLDVWGIAHDPRAWPDPHRFDPARFLADSPAGSAGSAGSAASAAVARERSESDWFVPQGGDSAATGHRCPGEGVTTVLLAVTIQELARREWGLPPQDLRFPERRMPTRPRSGVQLRLLADPAAQPEPDGTDRS